MQSLVAATLCGVCQIAPFAVGNIILQHFNTKKFQGPDSRPKLSNDISQITNDKYQKSNVILDDHPTCHIIRPSSTVVRWNFASQLLTGGR